MLEKIVTPITQMLPQFSDVGVITKLKLYEVISPFFLCYYLYYPNLL